LFLLISRQQICKQSFVESENEDEEEEEGGG
jgi:hypothetical protein